jgi:ribosomal protein L16 Arg81 hydroxylase
MGPSEHLEESVADQMEIIQDKVEEMYHMVKETVAQMATVKQKFDQKANEKNVSYNNTQLFDCRLQFI